MNVFRSYVSSAVAGALVLGLAAQPAVAAKAALDPSQFTVGTSTIADVERVYGKPVSESVSSDGAHVLAYGRVHAHAKVASFIPVVGLFAGGAVGSSETTVFTFDKDGHLKSYTSQSTNIDCKSPITGVNCTR